MSICQENGPPIETAAIAPVYYDCIGPVEIIDGMLHIVFSMTQPHVGGGTENVVVARLMVRPDKVAEHRTVIDGAITMAADFCEGALQVSH